MKRSSLSIAQRMTYSFGALSLILGALIASIYVWQSDSASAQRDFTQKSMPLSDMANNLGADVLRVGIRARSYLLKPDAAGYQAFNGSVRTVRTHLQRLQEFPKSEADQRFVEALAPAF